MEENILVAWSESHWTSAESGSREKANMWELEQFSQEEWNNQPGEKLLSLKAVLQNKGLQYFGLSLPFVL